MVAGFPVALLRLVKCLDDGGGLAPPSGVSDHGAIGDGVVRCTNCQREYTVRDGILRLLDEAALDSESTHELRLREAAAEGYDEEMRGVRQFDFMERLPTLAALEPLRDQVVLELGCGTGRFTVELARASRGLLAVDFSAASLRLLAAKLDDPGGVGLVQADVTRLAVTPGAFDRVVSTLVSNLPTRAHRDVMLRLAAGALRDSGVFVFSTHHYGLRERMRGVAKDGRYDAGGIYRRLFTRREIEEEVSIHFASWRSRPIQISLPLTSRLGFPLIPISRIAERLPVVRQLGCLLLVTARGPLRDRAGPTASRT